ncbi:hypothetical protein BGO17_03435 [Candidatus Saccharibacteria bacterium 49-20]|nr:MAG: hypothetical protein BGO17_03435 [Candidatus Saccharibacteria bacterium 49-20]
MLFSLTPLTATIEVVARAGGGGSSSGGGGGGELFALLGYFPSYYLGKLVKKLLPRRAELIVSATFASIVSIILIVLASFMGFIGFYIMSLIIIGIWAGWAAAFFGIWDRLHKRSKKAKEMIAIAAQSDSSWNEPALVEYAKQCFMRYQYDWSTFDLTSITTYSTPEYAKHSALLLQALRELGRTNRISNVEIEECQIIDVRDDMSANNSDNFTIAFQAKALDELIDGDGTTLFTDRRPFVEEWTFVRSGATWLLHDIHQNTASAMSRSQSLVNLASSKGMYYSLDMGWLLIPNRGVVMASGTFGQSDINNHVIGLYNGLLFQLYTYTPVPHGRYTTSMLIVQLTLPKSYRGILVQRTPKFFSNSATFTKPPKEYTKYTYEWPEFNQRYTVHATDADRLASFELINPGFMTYLYDNDPGIGIEVVDSTLYLFKYIPQHAGNIPSQSYEAMFEIAMRAYKELRL